MENFILDNLFATESLYDEVFEQSIAGMSFDERHANTGLSRKHNLTTSFDAIKIIYMALKNNNRKYVNSEIIRNESYKNANKKEKAYKSVNTIYEKGKLTFTIPALPFTNWVHLDKFIHGSSHRKGMQSSSNEYRPSRSINSCIDIEDYQIDNNFELAHYNARSNYGYYSELSTEVNEIYTSKSNNLVSYLHHSTNALNIIINEVYKVNYKITSKDLKYLLICNIFPLSNNIDKNTKISNYEKVVKNIIELSENKSFNFTNVTSEILNPVDKMYFDLTTKLKNIEKEDAETAKVSFQVTNIRYFKDLDFYLIYSPFDSLNRLEDSTNEKGSFIDNLDNHNIYTRNSINEIRALFAEYKTLFDETLTKNEDVMISSKKHMQKISYFNEYFSTLPSLNYDYLNSNAPHFVRSTSLYATQRLNYFILNDEVKKFDVNMSIFKFILNNGTYPSVKNMLLHKTIHENNYELLDKIMTKEFLFIHAYILQVYNLIYLYHMFCAIYNKDIIDAENFLNPTNDTLKKYYNLINNKIEECNKYFAKIYKTCYDEKILIIVEDKTQEQITNELTENSSYGRFILLDNRKREQSFEFHNRASFAPLIPSQVAFAIPYKIDFNLFGDNNEDSKTVS